MKLRENLQGKVLDSLRIVNDTLGRCFILQQL